MQELLLPHMTRSTRDPFDNYHCFSSTKIDDDRCVCIFARRDGNDKRLYMVGIRVKTPNGYRLTDVKEFRHAYNRALRYYDKRISDG